MTDQDELRARIETVLDRFTSESWGNHHQNAAQAIIDELGLSMEAGKIMGDGHGFPGVDGVRTVGKWEKK